MAYLGDLLEDQSVDFTFTTIATTGVPTTLAGSPVLSVWKANSVTQTTTGPTLSVDFDAVTGLNHVRMATTDAFYVVATDYSVVITTGTVNGVSVVGYVVAQFSIENRNTKANLVSILGTALTETAGLIAGGFKKLFNVATPTGTLNSLPGAVPGAAGGIFIAGTNAATTITTALTSNIIGNITGNLSGTVGSVTGAVGSVAGAVGSVGAGGITAASLASNTITADKIATDAITAAKIAADAIGASELAAAAVTKIWDAANFSGISTGRTVTITLKDTNTSGAVIDSARIEIWADGAVAPMYALTNATNASGQFTPRLADGDYTAVIAKPAVYTFSNQDFTVAAGAVTFEWYGTPVSVTAPPSAVTSTLYGYCVTAAGAAAEGIQVSAKSVLSNLHSTTMIVTNLASTDTTDVNGYFALTVMRNEPLLVTIEAAGYVNYPVTATAATVDLGTLVVASA